MDTNITGISQLPTAMQSQPATGRNPGSIHPQDATPTSVNPQARNDEKKAVATEEVRRSAEAINDFVKTVNRDLRFSVDEDTGKTVVRVIDQATDQLIRQIPSEEVLAIAKALDKLQGLLIHQKA